MQIFGLGKAKNNIHADWNIVFRYRYIPYTYTPQLIEYIRIPAVSNYEIITRLTCYSTNYH